MFTRTELIEETGRLPGLIFCKWGYFWPGSGNVQVLESAKNNIKAYISHPNKR